MRLTKKWPKPIPKIYYFPPGEEIDLSHAIQRWFIKKIKNMQLRLEGAENDQKWPKMRI